MEKKQYLNIDKPIDSWMWDAAYYVAEPAGLLEFCSKNGITELYISVNNNVTDMRYADLLRWCTSAGIRVSALTGEPNWIYPDRRQGYYSFLERVAAIQRTCKGAARFSALHMDANPHSLPEAKANGMESLAGQFVSFVRTVRSDAERMGLPLEWDLPSWYHAVWDERGNCTLAESVMRICQCVNILCFRDTAKDQLEALRPNLNIAKKLNIPFRIASETLTADEERRPNNNSRVTYYEEGYLYMYDAISIINQTVEGECDDYGFAIHDIKRWMTLQPDPLPQYKEGCEEMDMDQYLLFLKAIGH